MEEKKIQNVLNLWKSMEENPARRDILVPALDSVGYYAKPS